MLRGSFFMNRKMKTAAVICLIIGLAAGTAEILGSRITDQPEEEEPPGDAALVAKAASPHEGKNIQDSADLALGAEGAILIDTKDKTVLFEKNADKKLYPASTTKIMTALVALETLEEIGAGQDSRVTVPDEAAGLEGSSVYLKAGQQVTMEELLYGMMLQSGNDAAAAVAICCGGDMETFVEKMNDKAAALGCGSTHFTNPSGLHDEGHYTTARDLAIIGAAAMEREDFRRIVSAESWQSQDTGRSYVNKNKTLFQYDGGNGIKIGYTKASGRTLAASAERDGKVLIAVVLNDHNWFEDAYGMLDYGFEAAG